MSLSIVVKHKTRSSVDNVLNLIEARIDQNYQDVSQDYLPLLYFKSASFLLGLGRRCVLFTLHPLLSSCSLQLTARHHIASRCLNVPKAEELRSESKLTLHLLGDLVRAHGRLASAFWRA